jgi:hypothetical protein
MSVRIVGSPFPVGILHLRRVIFSLFRTEDNSPVSVEEPRRYGLCVSPILLACRAVLRVFEVIEIDRLAWDMQKYTFVDIPLTTSVRQQ